MGRSTPSLQWWTHSRRGGGVGLRDDREGEKEVVSIVRLYATLLEQTDLSLETHKTRVAHRVPPESYLGLTDLLAFTVGRRSRRRTPRSREKGSGLPGPFVVPGHCGRGRGGLEGRRGSEGTPCGFRVRKRGKRRVTPVPSWVGGDDERGPTCLSPLSWRMEDGDLDGPRGTRWGFLVGFSGRGF